MPASALPERTPQPRAKVKRQGGNNNANNAISLPASSAPASSSRVPPPLTTPPLLTAEKPSTHNSAELSTLAGLEAALKSQAGEQAKQGFVDNAATLDGWAAVFHKSQEEVAAWLTSSEAAVAASSKSADEAKKSGDAEAAAKSSADAARKASEDAERSSSAEAAARERESQRARPTPSPPAENVDELPPSQPPPPPAAPVTSVIAVQVPTTIEGKPTEVPKAITSIAMQQSGAAKADEKKGGLSTGGFIAIAIAAVVVLTVLLFICLCLCKKRRRQRKRRHASEAFLSPHRPAYEDDNLPSGIAPLDAPEEDATVLAAGAASRPGDDAKTTAGRSYMPATLARFFPPKPPPRPPRPMSSAMSMSENSAGVGAFGHSRSGSGDSSATIMTNRSRPPRALQPGDRRPFLDAETLAPALTVKKPPPALPLPYNRPPRNAAKGDGKTMRRMRYSTTTSAANDTDRERTTDM